MLAHFEDTPRSLRAFAQTTTTEVPRIVGDPLPVWQVLAAATLLLVLILAAGLYVRGRASRSADRR